MKSLFAICPRHSREISLWQRIEKKTPVSFLHYAGIQNGDHSSVTCRSYEPTDSLPKLDQSVRQRELVEGITISVPNVIALCLRDRMRRGIERQARDDHLRQGVSWNVDAGPETVRAE